MISDKKTEILKRLDEIAIRIKTANANALRFYDDSAEVSIQYQIVDELIAEKTKITEELSFIEV